MRFDHDLDLDLEAARLMLAGHQFDGVFPRFLGVRVDGGDFQVHVLLLMGFVEPPILTAGWCAAIGEIVVGSTHTRKVSRMTERGDQ